MLVSYSPMTMVQYEGHRRCVLISCLEVATVQGGGVTVLCFVVHIDVLIQ